MKVLYFLIWNTPIAAFSVFWKHYDARLSLSRLSSVSGSTGKRDDGKDVDYWENEYETWKDKYFTVQEKISAITNEDKPEQLTDLLEREEFAKDMIISAKEEMVDAKKRLPLSRLSSVSGSTGKRDDGKDADFWKNEYETWKEKYFTVQEKTCAITSEDKPEQLTDWLEREKFAGDMIESAKEEISRLSSVSGSTGKRDDGKNADFWKNEYETDFWKNEYETWKEKYFTVQEKLCAIKPEQLTDWGECMKRACAIIESARENMVDPEKKAAEEKEKAEASPEEIYVDFLENEYEAWKDKYFTLHMVHMKLFAITSEDKPEQLTDLRRRMESAYDMMVFMKKEAEEEKKKAEAAAEEEKKKAEAAAEERMKAEAEEKTMYFYEAELDEYSNTTICRSSFKNLLNEDGDGIINKIYKIGRRDDNGKFQRMERKEWILHFDYIEDGLVYEIRSL